MGRSQVLFNQRRRARAALVAGRAGAYYHRGGSRQQDQNNNDGSDNDERKRKNNSNSAKKQTESTIRPTDQTSARNSPRIASKDFSFEKKSETSDSYRHVATTEEEIDSAAVGGGAGEAVSPTSRTTAKSSLRTSPQSKSHCWSPQRETSVMVTQSGFSPTKPATFSGGSGGRGIAIAKSVDDGYDRGKSSGENICEHAAPVDKDVIEGGCDNDSADAAAEEAATGLMAQMPHMATSSTTVTAYGGAGATSDTTTATKGPGSRARSRNYDPYQYQDNSSCNDPLRIVDTFEEIDRLAMRDDQGEDGTFGAASLRHMSLALRSLPLHRRYDLPRHLVGTLLAGCGDGGEEEDEDTSPRDCGDSSTMWHDDYDARSSAAGIFSAETTTAHPASLTSSGTDATAAAAYSDTVDANPYKYDNAAAAAPSTIGLWRGGGKPSGDGPAMKAVPTVPYSLPPREAFLQQNQNQHHGGVTAVEQQHQQQQRNNISRVFQPPPPYSVSDLPPPEGPVGAIYEGFVGYVESREGAGSASDTDTVKATAGEGLSPAVIAAAVVVGGGGGAGNGSGDGSIRMNNNNNNNNNIPDGSAPAPGLTEDADRPVTPSNSNNVSNNVAMDGVMVTSATTAATVATTTVASTTVASPRSNSASTRDGAGSLTLSPGSSQISAPVVQLPSSRLMKASTLSFGGGGSSIPPITETQSAPVVLGRIVESPRNSARSNPVSVPKEPVSPSELYGLDSLIQTSSSEIGLVSSSDVGGTTNSSTTSRASFGGLTDECSSSHPHLLSAALPPVPTRSGPPPPSHDMPRIQVSGSSQSSIPDLMVTHKEARHLDQSSDASETTNTDGLSVITSSLPATGASTAGSSCGKVLGSIHKGTQASAHATSSTKERTDRGEEQRWAASSPSVISGYSADTGTTTGASAGVGTCSDASGHPPLSDQQLHHELRQPTKNRHGSNPRDGETSQVIQGLVTAVDGNNSIGASLGDRSHPIDLSLASSNDPIDLTKLNIDDDLGGRNHRQDAVEAARQQTSGSHSECGGSVPGVGSGVVVAGTDVYSGPVLPSLQQGGSNNVEAASASGAAMAADQSARRQAAGTMKVVYSQDGNESPSKVLFYPPPPTTTSPSPKAAAFSHPQTSAAINQRKLILQGGSISRLSPQQQQQQQNRQLSPVDKSAIAAAAIAAAGISLDGADEEDIDNLDSWLDGALASMERLTPANTNEDEDDAAGGGGPGGGDNEGEELDSWLDSVIAE